RRSEEIHRRFSFQFDPLQVLKRDDFWTWTLKFWTDSDLRGLDRIAAELLYECPQAMSMEATNWLYYLERLCSRTQLTICDANSNGIFIGKLETAKSLNLKDVAIIGLSDSGVKDRADVNVSQQDIDKIFSDLGYFLLPPDRR